MISSEEFTEWVEYYKVEPWGYEADNWRAAMIASTIAASQGASVPLEDFLPQRTSSADTDPAPSVRVMEAVKAFGDLYGRREEPRDVRP